MRASSARLFAMASHSAVSKFVFPILCALLSGAVAQTQDDLRLVGTVSDGTSVRVEGVSVLLSSLDRAFQTRSNTAGRFRFENVPGGLYELEVSTPGFVKQTPPVDLTNGSQSLAIVLKVGSMPDMNYCGPHSSIVYEPSTAMKPRLDGVIQDYENHKPVAKADVTIWRASEKVSSRRSDQAGNFMFNGLPAGYYDLRISRQGYGTENVKGLLLPRENGVSVEISLLKRKKIVVCQ